MTTRDAKLIETAPSTQRVLNTLRAAHALRSMALIIGPTGTGKSAAVRHYAKGKLVTPFGDSTMRVMTAEPATGDVRAFLIELAVTFGDRSEFSYRRGAYLAAKRAGERIGQLVADARPEPCLLIIDDAQHLGAASLEQLRSLHERFGLGVALVGSPTAAGKVAPIGALASRIGITVVLSAADAADIDAIAESQGVTDKAARRFLRQRGAQPGALHNVVNIIEFARPIAGPDAAIELRHLELASVITGRAS